VPQAKSSKIKHRLHKSLVPHSRNNYHPHAIRPKGLFVALMLLLGIQLAFNFAQTGKLKVLGYATNVSESALLEFTNNNRARSDVPELTYNAKLAAAAQAKAEHMIENNYWSHFSPEGVSPWDFVNDSGYEYLKAGENLAYGFADSSGIVKGWMDSPPHAANIMDPKFAEVGFGVASGETFQGDENTVIVAMYGQPISAVNVAQANEENVAQQAWTPQEIIRSEDKPLQALTSAPEEVSVFSAVTSGDAHWGIYLSVGLLLFLAAIYAMRHVVALHQLATKGEHFIHGHPMLEASIVYGLLWLVLASTYGVIG
jgi:uncharacterized protein YkwD